MKMFLILIFLWVSEYTSAVSSEYRASQSLSKGVVKLCRAEKKDENLVCKGIGTGFFISPNQVVTSFHFIVGNLGEERKVKDAFCFFRSENSSECFGFEKILFSSAFHDVTVLSTEFHSEEYYSINSVISKEEDTLPVMAHAVGFPLGVQFRMISVPVTIISQTRASIPYNYVDYNLRGASGAPLLHEKEIKGMVIRANQFFLSFIPIYAINNMLMNNKKPPCTFKLCLQEELNNLIEQAESGHPSAQFRLGNYYLNGVAVEKSMERAIYWWGQAARGGHATAQYHMGITYSKGEDISKNDERAMAFYRQSALQNNPDAQYNLALMYLERSSWESNSQSVYWMEQAARNFHFKAQEVLGTWYMHGTSVVEQDREKGFYWLSKAYGIL